MKNLNFLINQAIKKMNGENYLDYTNKKYFKIYPFTTENISAYINKFNLKNKSLLTVGSSGDQVINAALQGCTDITVCDICPFTKYYFYLKQAGIVSLDYREFFEFFRYAHYPKSFESNNNAFNIETYKKIKSTLKLLNHEAYSFWNELFLSFTGQQIRKELFFWVDEYETFPLKRFNRYLCDENTFNNSKNIIKNIKPKFIIKDIYSFDNNDIYDNIFLSNIAQFTNIEHYKHFINKMVLHLNNNGLMLLAYLYCVDESSKYGLDYAPICDIQKTKELFADYISEIYSFPATNDILQKKGFKDSILIYKKEE